VLVETRRKGLGGTVYRASLLPVRYGISPDRIVSRLVRMIAMMARWDTRPTIPITASILERHPGLLRRLRDADLAVHGYRHISYADTSLDEKRSDLDAACNVFSDLGLVARGFRAPYLRADRDTLDLVRHRGFLFDSSSTHFALPAAHPISRAVRQLVSSRYGEEPISPAATAYPTFVEMPVSLPDDEILVDALGMHSTAGLWHAFEAMMEMASLTGSHLVLQVHPERFHICEAALELLLERASDAGGWLTPLSEAADWVVRSTDGSRRWPGGHSFALSVTGDLDAVSIGDFASRIWRK
jgi:hypothetical protein